MLTRRLRLRSNLVIALAVPAAAIALLECATSSTSGTFGNGSGLNGSNGSTVSNGSISGLTGGNNGGNGGSGDSGRPERCNDAGCTCFNIASIGYGGSTGAQAGHGGTDNTEAFIDYINTQSSARAAQIGCGSDTGCTSPPKPTLSAAFLAQYDVLIFQWMANSIAPVTYMVIRPAIRATPRSEAADTGTSRQLSSRRSRRGSRAVAVSSCCPDSTFAPTL